MGKIMEIVSVFWQTTEIEGRHIFIFPSGSSIVTHSPNIFWKYFLQLLSKNYYFLTNSVSADKNISAAFLLKELQKVYQIRMHSKYLNKKIKINKSSHDEGKSV